MNKAYCKKMVFKHWHSHQCEKKIWKDGFCKQHHPDEVRKRDEIRQDKWRAEAAEREQKYFAMNIGLEALAALRSAKVKIPKRVSAVLKKYKALP